MGKLGVVVVAAGRGTRMRTAESKQYLMIEGKTILAHTLETFQHLPEADEIVVVSGQGDEERCWDDVRRHDITKVSRVVSGGKERQHSVYNGLLALSEGVEDVLVHDAVRPFAEPEHILACWRKACEAGAAVLAVPVKDTIKVVGEDGTIQSTPDRRSLRAIQTPQAFRLSALIRAHREAEAAGFVGTDDAMLVERIGMQVSVVEGSYDNIKITTPEDLPLAEWLLHKRRGVRST